MDRIVSANPDGTDGGTYELPPQLASSVLNAQQLGGQPLALAAALTTAAGLSLAMTVLVDVRRRRHEFAVLKALGMARRQVWAVVAWQTTLTLLIASWSAPRWELPRDAPAGADSLIPWASCRSPRFRC